VISFLDEVNITSVSTSIWFNHLEERTSLTHRRSPVTNLLGFPALRFSSSVIMRSGRDLHDTKCLAPPNCE